MSVWHGNQQNMEISLSLLWRRVDCGGLSLLLSTGFCLLHTLLNLQNNCPSDRLPGLDKISYDSTCHKKLLFLYLKKISSKFFKVYWKMSWMIERHSQTKCISVFFTFRAEKIYEDYNNFRAIIRYDGLIRWEPGGVFKTMCQIDITYYPFDRQMCELVFGAWSYHTSKMNLTSPRLIKFGLIQQFKKSTPFQSSYQSQCNYVHCTLLPLCHWAWVVNNLFIITSSLMDRLIF